MNSVKKTFKFLSAKGSNGVSIIQRCLWCLNIFYYQVLAVITLIFLWTFCEQFKKDNKFFWHVFLTTAAYIPLMAIAIIAFSEDNLLTLHITRSNRYFIHGMLLFISFIFVTIGIAIEIDAKNKYPGATHFKSNHAILGLVSWILVIASVFIGVLAAKTQLYSVYVKPVIIKFLHNFLGIAGFVLGIASFWQEMKFFQGILSNNAYHATYYGLTFVTAWSLLAAIKSLYRQIKNIVS